MRSRRLAGKKWLKRCTSFLLLLLFFFAANLFANFYFAPMLSWQLKKTVAEMSGGLYQADFSSLRLYLLSGRIVVNDLRLKPDNAVFNRLKTAGLAPNTIYDLQVKKIVLSHFHPFKLYFKKELDIDRITIDQPVVQAFYHNLQDHNVSASGEKLSLYRRISDVLKSLHVAKIVMDNINLRYREETDHKITIRHLQDIEVVATDLLIDQNSENDQTRFDFCKDITAIFNDYHGRTLDGLYHYGARSVVFSSSQASVKLADAVFMPIKSRDSIAGKSTKPMRAMVSLQADSVTVSHFDYQSFIGYRNFIAGEVAVFGGKTNIFFDRTLPRPAAAAQNSGLHMLLKNIKHNIIIGTLHLQDIDVGYSEISPKTKLFGTITFEHLSGDIKHLATGNDTLQSNRNIAANLSANLMGYGKLDVNLHFNAADPAGLLYYKGTLGTMNLANLNAATKPLALLQFTSGFVSRLDFDMRADAQKTTGKVLFLYKDLNVMLLRQDEKNGLRRMGFMSVLANAMVLVRDNPTYGHAPRMANVVYERAGIDSYIGMIWRSIFTGIKQSIGFSAEIEKTIRQKISDQKENKVLRQQKKAERQERRKTRRLKRHLKEARDY